MFLCTSYKLLKQFAEVQWKTGLRIRFALSSKILTVLIVFLDLKPLKKRYKHQKSNGKEATAIISLDSFRQLTDKNSSFLKVRG